MHKNKIFLPNQKSTNVKFPVAKTANAPLKPIRIAFSGSGYLAPAHAGFVVALMDAGFEIVETAGTSGGSIVAALIASGMNQAKIKDIVFSTYPKNIVSPSVTQTLFGYFHKTYYYNNGNVLSKWLQNVLGDLTFSNIKMPITIMATDIADRQSFMFSRNTTPNEQLAKACLASSAVPFVYKPVIYNGKTLVDGGVANNIPTDKLQNDRNSIRVGVRINSGGSGRITPLFQYVKQNINCLLDANENNLIAWAKSTGAYISEIDCDPYDFLNADIDIHGKTDLFQRGYSQGSKLAKQLKLV